MTHDTLYDPVMDYDMCLKYEKWVCNVKKKTDLQKNKYAGFCKRMQTTKQTKPKARFCDVKF